MSYISPGFPASGADSATLVVEPSGKVDVLYQGYQVTNKKTYALGPGYSYFTSSPNHGNTWSTPVKVGASAGTMSTTEWWIDGDIGIDAGGSLYATWDTQGPSNDIGWVSYSTDGGQNWSAPIQAPADVTNAPHIVEVAGGPSGIAYVGWLSDSSPSGYAEYLRTFSTVDGESWLSPPQQVSSQFGDPTVWPGDTFGISTLSPTDVLLSWGSDTQSTGPDSEIFEAPVSVTLP